MRSIEFRNALYYMRISFFFRKIFMRQSVQVRNGGKMLWSACSHAAALPLTLLWGRAVPPRSWPCKTERQHGCTHSTVLHSSRLALSGQSRPTRPGCARAGGCLHFSLSVVSCQFCIVSLVAALPRCALPHPETVETVADGVRPSLIPAMNRGVNDWAAGFSDRRKIACPIFYPQK